MTASKTTSRFQPGRSGNPKGRPPGTGEIAKLRTALAADVPDILAGLVASAKGGDTQAARLILERVIPALKPTENTVDLQLPDGSLSDQGRVVLRAISAGELSPGQGAVLIGAMGSLARVAEMDELAARVAALESKHGKT